MLCSISFCLNMPKYSPIRGQWAHLRNQFKSKNTFAKSYDYIITLNWRGKTRSLSLFVKPWVSFIKWCFVPSFVDIGSVVLEKIFKFRQWIFAISLLSPLGKGLGPLFVKNLNNWRKFLNFVNVFSLFRKYFPLENEWPFIWTNLFPLYTRMLWAKFGYNWPSGSWEEVSWKCEKFTNGQTDGRQLIRKAQVALNTPAKSVITTFQQGEIAINMFKLRMNAPYTYTFTCNSGLTLLSSRNCVFRKNEVDVGLLQTNSGLGVRDLK